MTVGKRIRDLRIKNFKEHLRQKELLDYGNDFNTTVKFWNERADDLCDNLAGLDKPNVTDSGEYKGKKRLENVIRNINFVQEKWGSHQADFFSIAIGILLPLILGDNVDACIDNLKKEYGFKTIKSLIDAICSLDYPRGSGKTTASCALITSLLAEIPNVKICFLASTESKAKSLFKNMHIPMKKLINNGYTPKGAKITVSGTKIEIETTLENGMPDIRWCVPMTTGGAVSFFLLFFFYYFLKEDEVKSLSLF